MTTKEKNLELWSRVERTNPKFTESFEYGNKKLTAVDAYYQIKKATSLWGPYGSVWGLKDMNIAKYGEIAVLKAVFYYPGGEFEIINSISLGEKDFAKKLETDTLTKALSKLGFNADIFMGRFEDARYVEALKQQIRQRTQRPQSQTSNSSSKPSESKSKPSNADSDDANRETQIIAALKQHNLGYKKEGVFLIATGKTFEKKDFLKSIGFSWKNQKWVIPIPQLKLA